jgi:hypothetical protein
MSALYSRKEEGRKIKGVMQNAAFGATFRYDIVR